MNNTLVIAATFALAIGTSYVIAQTASPTQPTSTPPTATPPPTDTPMSPRTNMPMTGPRTMGHAATPPEFGTLDPTSQGYITKEQATSNPWLSAHFAGCDTNHNGQVTREEYMKCTAGMP